MPPMPAKRPTAVGHRLVVRDIGETYHFPRQVLPLRAQTSLVDYASTQATEYRTTRKSDHPMHHPFDDQGNRIDASFSLEMADHGFAISYASRGGTKGTTGARNIQYHVGLQIVLERLKELGATITDILLDSSSARQKPLEMRRLRLADGIDYPIALSAVDDSGAFRRKISDAQKDVLAAPGRHAKHGNRMRSIRMSFRLPAQHTWMNAEQLAERLINDEAVRLTADAVEFQRRTSQIRSRGKVKRPAGNRSPSAVEASIGRRFKRSPVVAAYVLQRANDACELCGKSTFLTDLAGFYLEIHHVIQLAAGGPDTPENTVAVCANCHRELHFGINRQRLTALLYDHVVELNQ